MPDCTALRDALNNTNYAGLLLLLDAHFEKNPDSNYSTLKRNIEHYLSQGLMPVDAHRQSLEIILNNLCPPPGSPGGGLPAPQPYETLFQSKFSKKTITLFQTVNCNRWEHYDRQLRKHYESEKNSAGNLLYLISACRTQKPQSLAKRLAYWFDEEFPMRFSLADDSRKDEVSFLDFPLENKQELTFTSVWELMQSRFLHKKVDFDNFLLEPASCLPLLEQGRVLLTFQVEEQDFREYRAAEHIDYLLKKFGGLAETYQKFVFCFAFFFDDAHDSRQKDCQDLLKEMDILANNNKSKYKALHLNCLPPVHKNDFQVWWNNLFDHHCLNDALGHLTARTPQEKQEPYRQQSCFDMETIEELQYAAYSFYRDKY